MKCTNKALLILSFVALTSTVFAGCGKEEYSMKFSRNLNSSSYTMVNIAEVNSTLPGYTENLCVDFADYDAPPSLIDASAGGLFDLTDRKVLYGKDLYASMNPASLTKVMTALVALKYGNLSERLVVTEHAMVTESGAQTAGLRPGDTMTLEQALNIMMVSSANDAALAVAEHVGGSVGEFVDLMNAEALRIGATKTHFTNPHGLTDDDHKTTPYDLYLIFNEALKYDMFKTIISQVAYTTGYNDANGAVKEASFESTNLFFKGTYQLPQNISCMGGKTGTTSAAGSCLIIYATDSASGKEYISVIMDAPDREASYNDTETLYSLGNSL